MTADSRLTFRFAPSPNGELHLGHAYSALVGYDMAKRRGGRFLLRIEDIDVARCRENFVAQILDDLHWLGIRWEEPVLRQSRAFSVYSDAAKRLDDLGVLYPCFATRTEIATAAKDGATDPDGAPLYPGLHANLTRTQIAEQRAEGKPFALRLNMDRAIQSARALLRGRPLTFTEISGDGTPQTIEAVPQRWGDAVIVRKDVPTSYHLSVTVDDARQGVSHVTRGQDLFASTDLQKLLQVLLGLPEPVYHHHALINDEEGRKLAKSARDTSLRSLRGEGAVASELRASLGFEAVST
jgi:glutamyl-Q tRNA(Asp) synthetase